MYEKPHLTITEMASKLGVTLDSSSTRILAQSLTRLSDTKGLKVHSAKCKTQNLFTKKWQVYTVNTYDELLYPYFQQLCTTLEIL